MQLEWLEDILAVAETGSFAEAAERRHLTASAFSRRIQQIEDHLGVELFDRTHKPVQLRPTTHINRDEISRLAAALRQLGYQLQRTSHLSDNQAVVASQHALSTTVGADMISRIHAEHAQLFVSLRSANAEDCLNLLLTRQADIALIYANPIGTEQADPAYLERITVGGDDLVPVIATSHSQRYKKAACVEQVSFIAYPDRVFLGALMDSAVLPRLDGGQEAIPVAETALTSAALELAVTGIGVAWVPKMLAARHIASQVVCDLSDCLPHCPLSITALRLHDGKTAASQIVWGMLGTFD
jgi:DNA-binding transcriptional LysR family regulator